MVEFAKMAALQVLLTVCFLWVCGADELDFSTIENTQVLEINQTAFVANKNFPELYGKFPDIGLPVPELVKKHGYPIEVYDNIKTEDGYLLTVHRIPHGRNNSISIKKKPVVFLMHGLLCSSADWVLTGPEKGLAFILADAGFDVFMGNARGNTYSRKHSKYNADKNKKKFWNFSWHQIGLYDLPVMLDLALEMSKQRSLSYVGHSQGTTSFFVLMTQKPEYNKKVKLMAALSPVAYMKNLPSPFLQLVAKFKNTMKTLLQLIGMHEFMPKHEIFKSFGEKICGDGKLGAMICASGLFLIAGFNVEQLDKNVIPYILSHTPAGASTLQIVHYAQVIDTGDFKQYDYGAVKNLATYGKVKPPKYDLSKITTPIAMFYGTRDLLAATEDVKSMHKDLPSAILLYKIDKFNHLDFLWAKDVKEILYEKVISLLKR